MINNKNLSWYILLIITFAIMGSMHPAVKILSGDVSPILLNFLRFFIATIVLIPFVLMNRVKIEIKDLKVIFLLGFFGITMYGFLDIIGVNLSTSINNSILLNSWPIILVILAPLLINEEIKKESVYGMIIGFFGVLLITTNGIGFNQLIKSEFFIGNLFILGSALSVTIYSMYNKKYIKKIRWIKCNILCCCLRHNNAVSLIHY